MVSALIALWLALSMPEGCAVTGQVIVLQDGQAVALLTMPPACPITVDRVGRVIHLSSERWVVSVEVPETPGKYPFYYPWGSAHAYFGSGPTGVWVGVTHSSKVNA